MSNEIDLKNLWGEPKLYKKIPIYPVQMKNIGELYDSIQSILIKKNTYQEPEIIKMSYLEFIMWITSYEENKPIFYKLIKLIQLITRIDNIKFNHDKFGYSIVIDDELAIRERDFDKIKKIIGQQNLINVEDDDIGSDFDKAKNEAKEFMNKRNKKMADIEQQIIAYKCESRSSYLEIKEMTIYQFRKELERLDLIKSADILQNAQYSGMVSFKEGTVIPHWLDQIEEKDPDSDIVMSKGELDKLISDNGLVSN